MKNSSTTQLSWPTDTDIRRIDAMCEMYSSTGDIETLCSSLVSKEMMKNGLSKAVDRLSENGLSPLEVLKALALEMLIAAEEIDPNDLEIWTLDDSTTANVV